MGTTHDQRRRPRLCCHTSANQRFQDRFLALEVINPTNGLVDVQPLPLTNGFRQLTLNLNGGDAALFKFSDGAPFVGVERVQKNPIV